MKTIYKYFAHAGFTAAMCILMSVPSMAQRGGSGGGELSGHLTSDDRAFPKAGATSAESDIDLLADFDKSKRLTLVTVGRLQSRLTDLLGVNVDLSSEEWMKEPVRKQALREAVLAF